ncbi:hypothetical protein ABVT39_008912 [Epinephelus coioides]
MVLRAGSRLTVDNMLHYPDEEEPAVSTKPQISFTMYHVEHDQDLDRMRRSSPPHTAHHPRRRYTADDHEWRYAESYVPLPPVSQASYSPPRWVVKDNWDATKEEMRQEIEHLRRRQDALLLKMARMEMDYAERHPRSSYERAEPPYLSQPSSTRPVPVPRQSEQESSIYFCVGALQSRQSQWCPSQQHRSGNESLPLLRSPETRSSFITRLSGGRTEWDGDRSVQVQLPDNTRNHLATCTLRLKCRAAMQQISFGTAASMLRKLLCG